MEYVVYVQAIDGSPLMPTRRFGWVNRALDAGRARVVKRKPFTIRLKYVPKERKTQPVHLGIDAGREHIGVAAVTDDGTPLMLAEVETRNKQVAKNMSKRKMYRVARRRHRREMKKRRARANHTAYEGKREVIHPGTGKPVFVDTCRGKQSRILHRVRKEDWNTPTVNHCVETHLNVVNLVRQLLPIVDISIEGVVMDFQKQEDPTIRGTGYQNGRLKGYVSVEDYIYHEQEGHCIFCDKPIAEYHHIVGRNRNGADGPENRAGLCKEHHVLCQTDKQWDRALRQIKKGGSKKYASGSIINAATPAIVDGLNNIFGDENVHTTYGYITKETRDTFGIAKSHAADAWCAAVSEMDTNVGVPASFDGYHFKQYRRHNRAAVSYIHERQYKDAGGKIVATNRHKRMDQKTDSLEEYRAKFGEAAVSRLSVVPAGTFYRSGEGWAPGTIVRHNGRVKTVRKTTSRGKSVYFEGDSKSASSKRCKLLSIASGLVCQ